MTAVATPDAARLVFAAVAGLILFLVLIIKFKVHAMISILIGAVGIGLMAGMPLSDIIGSVNEGIGNTLKGIALLVGLAVGHAFIPPTPGPVLVATMLGVDLGWVILIGIFCGIFCGIFAMIAAGPIWGSICGKKYMVEVPEHVAQQADIDESKLPKFGTIVGIIMIPLLLIIANSVAKVVPALAGIQPVLAFLGEPFMALLLATIAVPAGHPPRLH